MISNKQDNNQIINKQKNIKGYFSWHIGYQFIINLTQEWTGHIVLKVFRSIQHKQKLYTQNIFHSIQTGTEIANIIEIQEKNKDIDTQ